MSAELVNLFRSIFWVIIVTWVIILAILAYLVIAIGEIRRDIDRTLKGKSND